MQPQPLFHTSRQRESKLAEIDHQNLQAARIILELHQGGLMEEWAWQVLNQEPALSKVSTRQVL